MHKSMFSCTHNRVAISAEGEKCLDCGNFNRHDRCKPDSIGEAIWVNGEWKEVK
jgi:hypothetical protein